MNQDVELHMFGCWCAQHCIVMLLKVDVRVTMTKI
jgi:hypothetical protein